jgi:hypothetical protein
VKADLDYSMRYGIRYKGLLSGIRISIAIEIIDPDRADDFE